MTDEQLKQTFDALRAHLKGEPVEQSLRGGEWEPLCGNFTICGSDPLLWRYRPKHEQKTRPWSKPKDVPGPICWIREARFPTAQSMILGIGDRGVDYMCSTTGDIETDTWGEIEQSNCEYSTDRKTWHPCTITE